MKRFLLISCAAFILIIGTAGIAHAKVGDACSADGNPGTENASGLCVPKAAASVPQTTDGTNKQTTESETQKQDTAYNGVMLKIMGLFAWLLGVAAVTLDYAVYYTVVKMGVYVSGLSAVGVAWRILRDLGNIALIFGFLAIGISTIIGSDLYGWGQKMLPKLLMAAVALNFSLFFTEAIIDTGNLFATQFYTQIKGGQLPTAAQLSGNKIENIQNEGISGKIMSQLGMQNIYGKAVSNQAIFEGTNPWFIGFMGILLFITASFVMFSLAFILIARFVALIFIIIVAPIGVVGFAVPKLEGIGKSWRDKLFEQTITAPILLLMLYIALAVITDAQFLTGLGSGGNPDWNGTMTGNLAGFASTFLSFLVAMGLLLAVTMYAKKMGAAGAAMATKTAGKLTFGATAWGLRQTAGRGFQGASTKFNASRFSRVPVVGRAISGVLGRGAVASYDVRGSKAWDALSHTPLGKPDAGDAQKGGFSASQKARKDVMKAYDTTTKVARLKSEFAKTAPNPSEINKIMRSLSDDDFKDGGLLDLIRNNPLAVQALTSHQASILPDSVITNVNVYSNMSASQLEAIRTAGNMTSSTARTIGGLATIAAANAIFGIWLIGRTPTQTADLVAYWGP